MTEKQLYTNRLINQKSPYLLQHAHNPVDWYPWGEEAFSAARELDKPIFLSIGYATCHWCHVMEKESFENPSLAELLNETFINIKVDREELPEIDNLYMEFAQSMMSGTAGWPLNLVLTPKLLPFFAATYLPSINAHGLMGLTELIERIHEVWNGDEREEIITQSEKILEIFNNAIHIHGDELPDREVIDDNADLLFKLADPAYGGLKGNPKFPVGYQYNFLLNYYRLKKESRALFIVEKTLDMMHRGGIYDHLGGGFSRYSVDETWLIPHFEKMLYDNAILANTYLAAWQITKNPFYKQVSQEILNYVLRDMTHPLGGFYSAEDADSEGHEGLFYLWTYEEVVNILGKNESALFCEFYDVTPEGNFEGKNILHTHENLPEFSKKKSIPVEELNELFSRQRKILWTTRERRIHPLKDDKILCSWNGLMISTFALAGRAFNDQRFLDAAVKAANFIEENMVTHGHLLRRWREGESLFTAGLEEYAFLVAGYISLFETGCGSCWLDKALLYSSILEKEFKAENGAFFQTNGQDPNVILRKCQFSDGAEPSGNAIHCENLLKLYQITFSEKFLLQAEDVLKAVKKYIDNYPPGYIYHTQNLLRFYNKQAPSIIIALNESQQFKKELSDLIFSNLIPGKTVVWKEMNDEELLWLVPELNHYCPVEEKTTLYICYQGKCQRPINDFAEMQKALETLS